MSAELTFPDQVVSAASNTKRQPALVRVTALICALLAVSGTMLLTILAKTGLEPRVDEFGRFVLLAVLMLFLAGWCRKRFKDQRLTHAALAFAAATLFLMLAGLIANTGLRLQMPIADAGLAAADAALGLDMATVVRLTAETSWLTGPLKFAYNWSTLAVALLILGWLALGHHARAWELILTAFFCLQAAAIISVFFPAKGTAFFFDLGHLQGNGIPEGAAVYAGATFDWFYFGTQTVVGLDTLNGVVTFPSFHTVLALLATQALWPTKLKWPAVIWTAAVIVSTIPMGGHYAVDLAGGVLLWVAGCALAQWAVGNGQLEAGTRSSAISHNP